MIHNFAFFNVQGLCPQTVPSKVPFIENTICSKDLLFVGLSETWLNNHKEAELTVKDFSLFRCDSSRKKKSRGRSTGGVCLYIREDIAASCEVIFSHSSQSVQLLCVYSNIENLAILTVYRQPDDKTNGNPSTANDVIIPLKRAKSVLSALDPVPNIIFGGDFNLPKATWPDGLPKTGCPIEEKTILNALNEFCNEMFMSQYVNVPTHKDGNILDLVFTNNEHLIHDCSVVPVLQSTSHHGIVNVSTSLKVQSTVYDDDKPEPRSKFNSLNFFSDEIEWDSLKKDLSQIDWKKEFNNDDPQEILRKFNHLCYETCRMRVPPRTNKVVNKKSKVERYRRSLTKRRRKITKRLSKCTSQSKRAKITQELLQIEKDLQKSFKESKSYVENKAIDAIKKNSKYFFSYAKKKSKIKSKIGPLLNDNGKLTQRSKEMAEILSDQYVKVFSKPRTVITIPNEKSNETNEISDIHIKPDDLIKAINELSQSAAAGPDGFPALLLKQCKEELSIPLCILWQKSMEKGIVPDKLKRCTITPIHKGGSRSLAANYRPVALTSHVIKIFEKVLRTHIVKFMDQNNLFNPNQHGFRCGRSCLSQLLEQYDLILNILDEDANADVVYLDFSKAFDKVDHAIALQKIKNLGITGKIFQWLKSFLTERKQTVLVNGVKSEPQNVLSGVPQGSVLGPLIFLILIDDIDKNVQNCSVKSFADDTRATKQIKTTEDVASLQDDLERIYTWTNENNMKLNDVKFELLRYGPNQLIKDQTSYTSPLGKKIESKNVVKDLGVLMSNDCTFNEQIVNIIEKAKNISSWILRTFSSQSFKCMITLNSWLYQF